MKGRKAPLKGEDVLGTHELSLVGGQDLTSCRCIQYALMDAEEEAGVEGKG